MNKIKTNVCDKCGKDEITTIHLCNDCFNEVYNNKLEKGSRLWAFAMIFEGKKVRHKNFSIKNDYIVLLDNWIVDNHNKIVNLAFPKDGWELYELEQPKTMTLREAIFRRKLVNLNGMLIRGNESVPVIHGGAVNLDYIIDNLDKPVEIIEE